MPFLRYINRLSPNQIRKPGILPGLGLSQSFSDEVSELDKIGSFIVNLKREIENFAFLNR